MLSEIASSKKTNAIWFHLYEVSKVVKVIEIESRMEGAWGWREEEMKLLFNGYRVLVFEDEKKMEDLLHTT